MVHTVIVPGVGGSEAQHWQSWLQQQIVSSSRVQQKHWDRPLLNEWVAQFVKTVAAIKSPVQIVAHSFGCLTSVAALAEHPELRAKVKNLILVAPANPARFGESGFARHSLTDYKQYFHQLSIDVPTTLLISENDPWLGYVDALQLAQAWKLTPINLGQVGHINVASGFGLSLGFTLAYVSFIVLIPLSAVFIKSFGIGWDGLWEILTSERILKSLQLSFSAALIAATVNVIFGLLLAWCLVRYSFPGKRIVDALVDLPFALPTAVAGIALTSLYAKNGWIGQYLEPLGIHVAYTPLGITLALIFIGLPFVVRTVQPVLSDIETELEEAASALGANRWQTISKVILPILFPALLTGFALAFARGVGEYGSVIFIAGNMPYKTEIAPLMIISRLEEYDYAGATTIAVVMLVLSFGILFLINLVQAWASRRTGRVAQ